MMSKLTAMLRPPPSPESFVLFIGYPRSGHSLLGALINAHPQAILSHELDALRYIEAGFSRKQVLSMILSRDRWFQKREREWEGYSYQVTPDPDRRTNQTLVMGDKKGAGTTARIGKNPELLGQLDNRMQCRVRLIHYIRNPFDTISTMSRKGPHPYGQGIDGAMKFFSELHAINTDISSSRPGSVLTVHHENLIGSPESVLRELFEFLSLKTTPPQIDRMKELIFPTPSLSRDSVQWDSSQIEFVDRLIDSSPALARYATCARPTPV